MSNHKAPPDKMPRVAELSFQKFLEPIVSEIFDEHDVECGLKFLRLMTDLLQIVYLMGVQDGTAE